MSRIARMRSELQRASGQSAILLAILVAALALVWLLAVLIFPSIRFVILDPSAKAGTEVILALASLFGALVLLLFPDEGARLRLRWVAAGFLVLGLASLLFGYLYPLLVDTPDTNGARYASLLVQAVAGGLFAAGLLPAVPRRLPRAWLLLAVLAAIVLGLLVYQLASQFPVLAGVEDLERAATSDASVMRGLTAWHWALSAVPLALSVAAALGAAGHLAGREIGGWLLIAMTLRAAAQFHAMFWPAGYSPDLLTTASLLRLAFTVVVVVGAIVELRRIAAERAETLAAAQEYSRRLTQLAMLRTDFTRMVVHELNDPVAAIRRLVDVAAVGETAPHQARALGGIQQELETLRGLIADVELSASAERDEFTVQPGPVALDILLSDAETYARTLPGDHPCGVSGPDPMLVRADRERISQVLRNLLSNAAKYSPDRTPIEVRARRDGTSIRIAVIDQGSGIHPDDLNRVFEKFGRGRSAAGERVPGVGLGLYLSRRIVQAHGSDLVVESRPGCGSEFSFTLEVAG